MILKLKRTPGLYLVGFMGSGKSTVGRIVASELGWPFADVDEDIEREQRQSISAIFDRRGEEEFRKIETALIRKRISMIESGHPMVVAFGGGAFAREENFDLLENNGVTIWLDCPLEIIRRRIESSTHRPLARDPAKLEELYYTRRAAYSRADYRIEVVANDSARAAAEILKLAIF
jgi:shikimate kinase